MKQHTQPQSYTQQNPPMYIPNDEIDLRELFKALWDGKLLIILVTALFTSSAIGFALLAQEWWSSEAEITKAELQDRIMYQQQVKQFQPAFSIYQANGSTSGSKELDYLVNSQIIFQRFVDLFNSSNNKQDFLEQSAELKDIKDNHFANVSEITEDAERKFYISWLERVSASLADKKNKDAPYVLSFQSTTKESSFDLLSSYISFTELQVREDVFDHLEALVFGERNELLQQKTVLESKAKNRLLAEIERAQSALKIAKAAGVDTPLLSGNARDFYAIELGSKALQEKIKILESVKNLTVLEPRLLQITAQLDMLDSIKIDRTVDFHAFRYLSDVEQPAARDKPKRALIVVLGTLLGGMLGVAIVLIRFAFRKED
ncbi:MULTISPECIES: LPS O-antigen chain length determinant protein WzzB [Vibrio]|uniref:LPS O-antigen chain length determinant protein WzzB n=1 Tax=Vibrio TaxID=662 RepID=UPI00036C79FD|nr:LPS chain length-determining protein [Vibrio tasmaniensis]OEF70545.1 chain-length determining protein [Vibrio tasmaniensis 1F-155]PMO87131.1 chain-length determining protein [Vibrio tasmaniensis]